MHFILCYAATLLPVNRFARNFKDVLLQQQFFDFRLQPPIGNGPFYEPEVGNIGTGSRQCACENPQAFERDPFDFRFRCFQLPVDEK